MVFRKTSFKIHKIQNLSLLWDCYFSFLNGYYLGGRQATNKTAGLPKLWCGIQELPYLNMCSLFPLTFQPRVILFLGQRFCDHETFKSRELILLKSKPGGITLVCFLSFVRKAAQQGSVSQMPHKCLCQSSAGGNGSEAMAGSKCCLLDFLLLTAPAMSPWLCWHKWATGQYTESRELRPKNNPVKHWLLILTGLILSHFSSWWHGQSCQHRGGAQGRAGNGMTVAGWGLPEALLLLKNVSVILLKVAQSLQENPLVQSGLSRVISLHITVFLLEQITHWLQGISFHF